MAGGGEKETQSQLACICPDPTMCLSRILNILEEVASKDYHAPALENFEMIRRTFWENRVTTIYYFGKIKGAPPFYSMHGRK